MSEPKNNKALLFTALGCVVTVLVGVFIVIISTVVTLTMIGNQLEDIFAEITQTLESMEEPKVDTTGLHEFGMYDLTVYAPEAFGLPEDISKNNPALDLGKIYQTKAGVVVVTVTIIRGGPNSEMDLDAGVQSSIESMTGNPDVKNAQHTLEVTTVNGYDARKFTVEAKLQGATLHYDAINIQKGKYIYQVNVGYVKGVNTEAPELSRRILSLVSLK